eukprot:comp23278_c0_seq1/m.58534 comp23278_c0_seq1/g.58534  ORF comp23278_c0_seq1/g.58534 comp23278_c0_seq1/m.58534 type:complete len:317 (+) comp23278_c0_seq1:186-1136(+)
MGARLSHRQGRHRARADALARVPRRRPRPRSQVPHPAQQQDRTQVHARARAAGAAPGHLQANRARNIRLDPRCALRRLLLRHLALLNHRRPRVPGLLDVCFSRHKLHKNRVDQVPHRARRFLGLKGVLRTLGQARKGPHRGTPQQKPSGTKPASEQQTAPRGNRRRHLGRCRLGCCHCRIISRTSLNIIIIFFIPRRSAPGHRNSRRRSWIRRRGRQPQACIGFFLRALPVPEQRRDRCIVSLANRAAHLADIEAAFLFRVRRLRRSIRRQQRHGQRGLCGGIQSVPCDHRDALQRHCVSDALHLERIRADRSGQT